MTRRFSKPLRNERNSCTPRISKFSQTEAKPASSKAALPSVRFRKSQPRLPANPKAKSGLHSRVLTFKHKSLTLLQWSRRTKAGPPSAIWSRIKVGWPIEEALGGHDTVARALSYVTWKEARAIRGKAANKRRSKRKPVSRRSAKRLTLITSKCLNHA